MKYKMEIFVGIGIVVSVIVTMAFYLLNAGTIEINEIANTEVGSNSLSAGR